jgi:U3 small nucleolar RNA-associated protein 3
MQAKMMKQLDMSDFDLDSFKKSTKQLEEEKTKKPKDLDEQFDVEKILSNLTNIPKKDKLNFLRQESPELFELVKEFKEKVKEIEEVLIPINDLIREDKLPRSPASDFIFNKLKLYLMYCCHLGFYFSLKSERVPIENHPIIKNILQYRHVSSFLLKSIIF